MKTLKEKIAEGKIVNGTMLRVLRNPAVAYLADQAGLDFLMFDCEHANYSLETMHDINLTARALGISCMASVIASPIPTIEATFSVPARRRRS